MGDHVDLCCGHAVDVDAVEQPRRDAAVLLAELVGQSIDSLIPDTSRAADAALRQAFEAEPAIGQQAGGVDGYPPRERLAERYAERTGRRVSIEYILIKDINDQGWRADMLADVLHSYGDWGWVHVNLIPLNPIEGSKWTASDPADEREFVRRLEAKGIPTTVRDTRGREIDGACGQLAATET